MQDNNKTLLGALIIIGIIIIVILLGRSTPSYSYRGTTFTASALPINISTSGPATGSYSFVRYVPRTTSYQSTDSTYTYYTYPQTYYDHQYQTYYPNGCNAGTLYSATTGLPCN